MARTHGLNLSVFTPPEDYAGLPVWPTIDDQIALVKARAAQIERVLDFYTGKERDYKALSGEYAALTATLHTLRGVKVLTDAAV